MWEQIWQGVERIDFQKDREPYVWKFYEMLLKGYDFKGKSVLEFGCGTGVNSILMALRGAEVTFVDTSKKALDIVKINLDGLGLKGRLVCESVFDSDFKGEFDLVHSEGLVEHFLGKERQEIVNIHARAAKKGGSILIIVPHRKCPPYRLGKLVAEKAGTWIYENEHPYTKKELIERMGRAGLKPGKILGGEFLFSMVWLAAPLMLKSSRLIRKGIGLSANRKMLRLNYGNRFANRWGRVIGMVGKKL